MTKNLGKSTEWEFASKLPVTKNCYVHAFIDTGAVRTAVKAGFTQGQPADFLVTWDGDTFFAEVKSSHSSPSFPFTGIRKSQWAAAKKVRAANGLYYFFIKNELTSTWYCVAAGVLLDHPNASIKWSELEDHKWTEFAHPLTLRS